MYKMRAVTKKPSSKNKKIIIICAVSVFLAIALLVLELTNTTHFFHKKYTPHTSNQYTKGEVTNSNAASGKSSSQTDGQPNSTDDGGNTYTNTKGQSDSQVEQEVNVETPDGNFVSAHRISLASQPLLQSSCETTPKISCEISFTNGSTTVRLTAKTTDDGGVAYWTWKPQDIGITTGTWKIQATAKSGSNTKTTTDALNFEVTP